MNLSNRLKWIIGVSAFVLIMAAVIFLKTQKASASNDRLVGRDYSRQFLGMEYTVQVIGDSVDYSRGLDSLEALYRFHFDNSNPNSSVMKFNLSQITNAPILIEDRGGLFLRVLKVADEMHSRSGYNWDFSLTPAKVAWLPFVMSFKEGAANIDSLKSMASLQNVKLNYEVLADNQIALFKTHPSIEYDFQKIVKAMFMDEAMSYYKRRSKSINQIVIRNKENWVLTFGNQVDSLNRVNLWTDSKPSENNILIQDRGFASCNAIEKRTLIDPFTLAPVTNEMYQTYVTAPSMLESVIFAESFMVMGVEYMGSWYSNNEDSDIQSLVYFTTQDGQRDYAYTENFGKMMIQKLKK